jgi:hypothetical protein
LLRVMGAAVGHLCVLKMCEKSAHAVKRLC